MPFKPGHNIGRPSGSKNKASEVKKIIASVGAAFTAEEIIEDLKSMSPRSRIDALQNIWKYIEPTKKSVEVVSNFVEVISELKIKGCKA